MIERELYEKNVSFLDVDFTEMAIAYSADDPKREGFIIVKIGEETVAFYPMEFCECFYASRARRADRSKDLIEQAKIFVACKTNVIHVIERFKRFANDNQLVNLDFNSFINQVDTDINEVRLYIEVRLLNSQVEANKSTVETNKHLKDNNEFLKTIFRWTLFLTICGVFISGWALWYIRTTNEREQRKEKREVKSTTSDSQLQLKNSENALLKNENASYRKQIDSLKNVLEKP